MKWTPKNLGVKPQDPEYDDDYNEEEAYDAYLDACDERHDRED